MRSSTIKALLALIITVGLATCPAFAQTNTTGLNGTVTDAVGLKLSGATVTLMETETGKVTTLTSKAAGEFDFTQVVPGHYKVTVEHAGFSQEQIETDLLVATPQTLNFKLKVGDTQTVDVEAPAIATTLNQTDATLGKAFDNQQIEQLPYLANNTLSLLALQPGVVSLDATNTTDVRAGTINGARQDQTNITLDGTDNNDTNTGYAFTGVLRATRDSIEEFRVTTSGANADAGRSSGAQVSLQTKSGTNAIHGSAYYYYRDPAMAGNNWFNKQTELSNTVGGVLTPKPDIPVKILQDTFGASLGVPLIKDKLFFFGAYEGFKQASDSLQTLTVPAGSGNATDAGIAPGLKNGTLSYLNAGSSSAYTTLTPNQIKAIDPNCASLGGCPAGPGVNAAVVAFFNSTVAGQPLYPTANTAGGDQINTGAFSFVSPNPISQITNIGRIDYNLSSKQVLFVRGNLQSDNSSSAIPAPGQLPNTKSYGNSRGITAGHIWTVSKNMTNNFRYGWTRQDPATQAGVNNYNYVSFAAVSLPFSTSASTILLQNTQDIVDDFTIVKGKHTIQFGINDRIVSNQRYRTSTLFADAIATANEVAAGGVLGQNTSLDINNPALNAAASAAGKTVPLANTSFRSSYNSAVTAITGLISEVSSYANYTVGNNQLNLLPPTPSALVSHTFHSFEQEYYVQDQWRMTPKFTVTAGLRYALLGVPYEINGQQVRPATSMHAYLQNRIASMQAGPTAAGTFGTTPASFIYTVPGGPKNGAPGFWTEDKLDFAPRLAFNFSPDSKTSIRGGFMMTYDHFGQGAVDTYNDSYSFGLSSQLTKGVQGSVDTDPRFTCESCIPTSLSNAAPASGAFPIVQNPGSGGITQTFDDSLHTPYAETFNLSVQRELKKGLTLTATYNGRLGRRQLMLRDVVAPLNLKDPTSGTDYYSAMAALDKAYDAGVPNGIAPDNAYWTNLFPNLSCAIVNSAGATTATYNRTQAVYYLLARSNETATLYDIDVTGGLPYAAPGKSGARCVDPGVTLNRYFAEQYGSLYAQASVGSSNYNGGQVSIRHTVNRGFVYDLNYTFAKSMDMGSNPERSQANYIINTFNPSQMYAPSSFDVRHNISADWIAAIPFGHGQRFGGSSGKLVDAVLGGWQLTGIVKYSSAFPWSSSAFTSGWGTNWEISSSAVETSPISTPGHHKFFANGGTSLPSGAITGQAFSGTGGTTAAAISAAALTHFRAAYVGESGQRNELRADGYFSMDPGLSKSFHTFEKQSFKLTVEYFNVTNATRFGTPGSGSTGSTFGQYLTSAGILNSPRQAQVSGRYSF